MISKKARAVLLELAKHIAGKKKEHLYVVNAKSGKVTDHFVGTEKRVLKSKEVKEMLSKKGRGFVVLHNHPGGKAPSTRDVINALRSLYEGWVVVPNGNIWVYKGINKKPVSKKTAASVRRYKDIARGLALRAEKLRTGKKFSEFNAEDRAAVKKSTAALMMKYLKTGVNLPPLLTYEIVRANPSNPCCCCGPDTHCEARARRNPLPSDPGAVSPDGQPIGNLMYRITNAEGTLAGNIQSVYERDPGFLEVYSTENDLWTWGKRRKTLFPVGDYEIILRAGEMKLIASSRVEPRLYHYLGNGVVDVYAVGAVRQNPSANTSAVSMIESLAKRSLNMAVLAAAECVKTVLPLVGKHEGRPARAVAAAKAWARGVLSSDDVKSSMDNVERARYDVDTQAAGYAANAAWHLALAAYAADSEYSIMTARAAVVAAVQYAELASPSKAKDFAAIIQKWS